MVQAPMMSKAGKRLEGKPVVAAVSVGSGGTQNRSRLTSAMADYLPLKS